MGRQRESSSPLGGFTIGGDPSSTVPQNPGRSCENNIDMAAAFEQAAAIETDAGLQAQWQAWRDHAEEFLGLMYGGNVRLPTLLWISPGWQYLRAGADEQDQVNGDLVPIDTGAWSALAQGDDQDVAFDFPEFLATSTDAKGRSYAGFDPGFRAVSSEAETSRRDGVGSEATAYMALIARHVGDAAILARLPARETLTAPEQVVYDALAAAAMAWPNCFWTCRRFLVFLSR